MLNAMNEVTLDHEITEAFERRYEAYGKTRSALYSRSSWQGEIDTLFPHLAQCGFPVGTVNTGDVGDAEEKTRYILIISKLGALMFYRKPDGGVHYFCDEAYTACEAMKAVGLTKTSGPIETAGQVKISYIFTIANSYL